MASSTITKCSGRKRKDAKGSSRPSTNAERPTRRIQAHFRQGRAQNFGENSRHRRCPGHTVVTTLDLRLQELAEKALEAKAKRGAIVIIDPNTGDILAMASWPTYDPNAFIPIFLPRNSRNCRTIQIFRFCRALFVRLIRRVQPSRSRSESPRSKAGRSARTTIRLRAGDLSWQPCLSQLEKDGARCAQLCRSADRILRHVVLPGRDENRAAPIIDWARKLGFGAKCGIPLRGEVEGRVPNDQYMKATHGRKVAQRRHRKSFHRPGRYSWSRHCRWRKPWRSWQRRHVLSSAPCATGADA